jgi:hypothetical protein
MAFRTSLALAACVVLCAGVWWVRASAAVVIPGSGAAEKAAKDVPEQVAELQKKLANLESRIAALEKRPAYVTVPGQAFHRMPTVPKNWGEKEFNGIKYYIVPLDTKTITPANR